MVISPQGKTTPPAPTFESAVIAGSFNLRESETPYMLWGDGPLGLGVGFLLVWLLGVQIMAPIKED
jgi:apolipoprotein N-acyltransferase